MTPSISILLPTRGRPDHLRASVSSLLDFAEHPTRIEILLAVDDDDGLTPDIRPNVEAQGASLVVQRGPRHGYRALHHNWNALAAASKGDILISWNDDCEMMTPDWDRMLLEGPAYSVQFPRRDIMETADTTIPCTSRKVYEAMGHIALNCYGDAWLGAVSKAAGIDCFRNDVVFRHHRLNDLTTQEIREGVEWVSDFDSDEMRMARNLDVEKVVRAKDTVQVSIDLNDGSITGYYQDYHGVTRQSRRY